MIINNAAINTTTITITATAQVGTTLGVGFVDDDVLDVDVLVAVDVVTELVEELLVETLVDDDVLDVDVLVAVDVVTELVEELLVETPV